LGLAEDLFFLPLDRPLAVDRTRIAATESCRWRGRTLQGEVHDEHGWLMGGVAGHAGLFGTLHGVLALGEWILDLWQGRTEHSTIPVALLRTALERQLANGTWCLGFDTPTVGSSSSGRYFSPCSVGHLGFSGTSFWIDPKRDVVVVLLTNRVHPSRENTRIRRFRPFFHDQVMACLLAGLEA
jgi:CubicO group peptidase (beta-lactamase class C family)